MAIQNTTALKQKTSRQYHNLVDSRNHIETETISAAKTLTNEDSGKTFFVEQASAYEITLPLMSAIEAGWNVTFVLSSVDTNKVTIANNTAEDTLVGSFSTSEIADSATSTLLSNSAVDEVAFISGAQLGNTISIVSNGVNYFVTGHADSADHITIS